MSSRNRLAALVGRRPAGGRGVRHLRPHARRHAGPDARRPRPTWPTGPTATGTPWRSGWSTPRPRSSTTTRPWSTTWGDRGDLRARVGRLGTATRRWPATRRPPARGPRRRWDYDGTLSIAEERRRLAGRLVAVERSTPSSPRASTWRAPARCPSGRRSSTPPASPLSVGRAARIIGLEPRADRRPQPDQGRVPAAARHRPRRHRRGAQRPRGPARPLRHDHDHRQGSLRPGRPGHLPAARHPVPGHVPAGRADPRVRRPRARRLRRDHRRAAGGARPAVRGGRHGRPERPRGAVRDPAGGHPVGHIQVVEDGRDRRGRRPPVRGRGPRARAHHARPRGAVRRRGGAGHDDSPHRRRRRRLRRATSGLSPPGRSASSTGPWPASTPPGRRSRSSPPTDCSPRA